MSSVAISSTKPILGQIYETFAEAHSLLNDATSSFTTLTDEPVAESSASTYIANGDWLISKGKRRGEAEETNIGRLITGDDNTDIPPSTQDRRRTLVLCFDGIGKQFGRKNSNILQFFSMLGKSDVTQQMVYYQSGTEAYTHVTTPRGSPGRIKNVFDLAFATNLDRLILNGYEFLMQNYRQGDKICIFGFSRGAYIALALAGMIHKIGLLPAYNHHQVSPAYKLYLREDDEGWKQSVSFKKCFSVDVEIDFVGVWDTVVSSRIFTPRRLPFTASNASIKTFRQALSLDERRVMYQPSFYHKMTPDEVKRQEGIMASEPDFSRKPYRERHKQSLSYAKAGLSGGFHALKDLASLVKDKMTRGPEEKSDTEDAIGEKRSSTGTANGETDVLEVWFAGCHRDVGGGSERNDAPNSLARIPLRWMIRQCFLARTGIQFDIERLREVGLAPETLYPNVLPRAPLQSTLPSMTIKKADADDFSDISSVTARASCEYIEFPETAENRGTSQSRGRAIQTEDESDNLDALCRMDDRLDVKERFTPTKLVWWWMECSMKQHLVQKPDGRVKIVTSVNLARPREAPSQVENGINVHRTVKTRMEAGCLGYKPRLVFKVNPTWVD